MLDAMDACEAVDPCEIVLAMLETLAVLCIVDIFLLRWREGRFRFRPTVRELELMISDMFLSLYVRRRRRR